MAGRELLLDIEELALDVELGPPEGWTLDEFMEVDETPSAVIVVHDDTPPPPPPPPLFILPPPLIDPMPHDPLPIELYSAVLIDRIGLVSSTHFSSATYGSSISELFGPVYTCVYMAVVDVVCGGVGGGGGGGMLR